MKVKELIAKLQEFNPEAEVVHNSAFYNGDYVEEELLPVEDVYWKAHRVTKEEAMEIEIA